MEAFDYSSFIKDVGIVNIFIFHTIWVGLNSNLNIRAFGHCINFLGKKVTAPKLEGACVPMTKKTGHRKRKLVLEASKPC